MHIPWQNPRARMRVRRRIAIFFTHREVLLGENPRIWNPANWLEVRG